jgi:hypothetical protein
MNTNIDETSLARWLEDDLTGAELAAVETAVGGDESLLALRATTRALRRDLSALLPAVEEPPLPEFFNRRVAAALRRPEANAAAVAGWGRWWVPLGAAAGMALAFWAGTLTRQEGGMAVQPPEPAEVIKMVNEPGIYTPERGVDAEWFTSKDAAATVIVLSGVDAIPDDLDFTDSTAAADDSPGAQARLGTKLEREDDRL